MFIKVRDHQCSNKAKKGAASDIIRIRKTSGVTYKAYIVLAN